MRNAVAVRDAWGVHIGPVPDFFDFGDEVLRTEFTTLIGNAVPPKLTYVLALDLIR
jgi:hypothetical protein